MWIDTTSLLVYAFLMKQPMTVTEMARLGGKARMAALSVKQKRALALKGVRARRAGKKTK